MPVVVVSGIVTRYANYKENDRILTILTPDYGRIDCKARGCRKQTSPLLPCSEPFVFGEFELFSSKDKYTVNACSVKETFFPVRQDITRFAVGMAMLQLVSDTAQENDESGELFLLLYHALSFLAYGKSGSRDLFCCFLIRFLDRIGFRPSITACGICGRDIRGDKKFYFSPAGGGAVCAACSAGVRSVSGIALEAMRRMLIMRDDEMDKVILPGNLGDEVFSCLTEYVRNALEFGPKALDVLDQLT